MKKKFWNWSQPETGERVLEIDGEIASESWYDDDVTPKLFRAELEAGEGPVVLWINSPGGDTIAASEIYTMLMDYPGKITVKIDGIAASAASVIAMAGSEVLMSPTAMMMIHNPSTIAWGDVKEMQLAIDILNEVKESIINAYEIKTNLSRAKLAKLMDAETWMNAKKAVELGFADGILSETSPTARNAAAVMVSAHAAESALREKLIAKAKQNAPATEQSETLAKVDDLLAELMKKKH